MKNSSYIVFILLAGVFTALVGCEDSEPATSELKSQVTALRNGGKGWIVNEGEILKDGFDVTSQFDGFKLSFGEQLNFSTENSLPSVWPASGTWEFQNGNPNQILRSDGVTMSVFLSGNNLTLTFMGAGSSGGRIESIDGEYQFRLVSE